MKSLSIVIPAYNESDNFKRGSLSSVMDFLKKKKYQWEVIVVNDGSTDNTLELVKSYATKNKGFRVLDIPHGGKVAAVTAGVMDAKYDHVLFTDFDQSTAIDNLDKVEAQFQKKADVVIAERNSSVRGWTFFQKLRSKIFNLLTQIIALPGISDSQCGFKAFKTADAKKLFSSLKITKHTQKGGYMGAFDVELLFLARKSKLKICSIDVDWQYFESKRLKWTEPLKMLRDIVLVRLYHSYHLIPIIMLLLLTAPSFWDTVKPGYFSMHDDMQMIRQLTVDDCFKDGQIPCRWSKELGYGYGYPLFNYYPPLPYYIGQIFRSGGLSYMDTIKVIVVLNFIATGLAMYLLAQTFWGRWGGLVSALMYVYAPYHSVDIYVRGAINEAWALIWLPLIFWSLYKLVISNKSKYVLFVALSVAGLMLSHNPTLMIFAPGAVIWTLFWISKTRSLKSLKKLLIAGVWGFGLAAFFTLPVIFEQKYAHVETLVIGYFNYLAHFVSLSQLFIDLKWGYGGSYLGTANDSMSFQVGYLHSLGLILSLAVALLLFRKKKSYTFMIIGLLGLTIFYTFLAHEKSSFIWSRIKPLEYLQFPWRTLTLTIFGSSFLTGSIIYVVKEKAFLQKVLMGVFILAILFSYQNYFHWNKHYYDMTDSKKFSGDLWRLQVTSGIFDYLPKGAPLPPADPPGFDAELLSGNGIKASFKNSVSQKYDIELSNPDRLQLNTYYFPGWRYFVNGKEVSADTTSDKLLGRPQLDLSAGTSVVEAKFTRTPIRLLGDTLSAASLLAIIVLVVKRKRVSL